MPLGVKSLNGKNIETRFFIISKEIEIPSLIFLSSQNESIFLRDGKNDLSEDKREDDILLNFEYNNVN